MSSGIGGVVPAGTFVGSEGRKRMFPQGRQLRRLLHTHLLQKLSGRWEAVGYRYGGASYSEEVEEGGISGEGGRRIVEGAERVVGDIGRVVGSRRKVGGADSVGPKVAAGRSGRRFASFQSWWSWWSPIAVAVVVGYSLNLWYRLSVSVVEEEYYLVFKLELSWHKRTERCRTRRVGGG